MRTLPKNVHLMRFQESLKETGAIDAMYVTNTERNMRVAIEGRPRGASLLEVEMNRVCFGMDARRHAGKCSPLLRSGQVDCA